MTGKRGLVANLFGRLGATAALGALRLKFSDGVTILAYHRVLDVPNEDEFPFDIELVSASVIQFKQQMEYIRAHYQPITFATLLQYLDRGTSSRVVATGRRWLSLTTRWVNAFTSRKSMPRHAGSFSLWTRSTIKTKASTPRRCTTYGRPLAISMTGNAASNAGPCLTGRSSPAQNFRNWRKRSRSSA